MSTIVKKEFIYPSETSKKKQWRYTYQCSECGELHSKWYRKGTFHMRCPHYSKGGYNTEKFIALSKKHHGDTYDYSKSVYKRKREKVIVTCPIHGDFSVWPVDHMGGKNGCPKCAAEKRIEESKISLDTWKERLTKQHPHIQLISTETGYHSQAKFKCEKHGEFTKELGKIHSNAYLCCECYKEDFHQKQSMRQHLTDREASLYYVYIPALDMYKLGVTVNKLTKRLSGYKFNVIFCNTYPYEEAINLEHYLHVNLTDYRYNGTKSLIKDGNRELYKTDVNEQIKHLIGQYRSDSMLNAI